MARFRGQEGEQAILFYKRLLRVEPHSFPAVSQLVTLFNLSLGIIFWLALTLGQSKIHIDRTAKYAYFAGSLYYIAYFS